MKRKIIKQGHGTFTLTLPIKWAKAQGLNAGTEIDVSEQGNSLILRSENFNPALEKTEINIVGLSNKLVWHFISAAYRAGYAEIKINFAGIENDKEYLEGFTSHFTDWFYRNEVVKGSVGKLNMFEAIHVLSKRFVGLELTEQKPDYVILKQFGEISYKEFDNALRRIFMLLASMGKDISQAIEKNDSKLLNHMHITDTTIDRFEDYCLRVLNVKGYEEQKKTPFVYSTVFLLELVGDEYKRLAKQTLFTKTKISSVFLDFFNEANAQFEKYFDFFYNPNKEKAVMLFKKNDLLLETFKLKLKKATPDEKELLYRTKSILYFIRSLVELAIDLKCETIFEEHGTGSRH